MQTIKLEIDREYILSRLVEYKNSKALQYGVEDIGLFGSVARGSASEESDIDICIKTQKPDMFAMVHIKEGLQNIFHKSVDIVRLREKMNPYLKKRIEREAIYV